MQQTFYVMWLMLADWVAGSCKNMFYGTAWCGEFFLIYLSTSQKQIEQIENTSVDVIEQGASNITGRFNSIVNIIQKM